MRIGTDPPDRPRSRQRSPAEWRPDAVGVIEPSSRQRLKVSHLHRCHRLVAADSWAPCLLFTVVQGHSTPCQWAHAYALVPGAAAPLSHHVRFEASELEVYRQQHADHSLRWMDSEFMFELALDQILRLVIPQLTQEGSSLPRPERIGYAQLLRHQINGDIPLLDALLQQCGEHYLLHRFLLEIRDFPRLRTDVSGNGPRPAERLTL